MDLSLFSRDVIATAITLSHNMFDAAVLPGIVTRSCRVS